MRENFTLKLRNIFLKQNNMSLNKLAKKKPTVSHFAPRDATVKKIISYAKSVRGVEIKSDDKILISLN
jgi:hypothetical protein